MRTLSWRKMATSSDAGTRAWFYLEIPNPPADASYDQRMAHASIAALMMATSEHLQSIPTVLRLAMASYMQRWHPTVKLPEIDI